MLIFIWSCGHEKHIYAGLFWKKLEEKDVGWRIERCRSFSHLFTTLSLPAFLSVVQLRLWLCEREMSCTRVKQNTNTHADTLLTVLCASFVSLSGGSTFSNVDCGQNGSDQSALLHNICPLVTKNQLIRVIQLTKASFKKKRSLWNYTPVQYKIVVLGLRSKLNQKWKSVIYSPSFHGLNFKPNLNIKNPFFFLLTHFIRVVSSFRFGTI